MDAFAAMHRVPRSCCCFLWPNCSGIMVCGNYRSNERRQALLQLSFYFIKNGGSGFWQELRHHICGPVWGFARECVCNTWKCETVSQIPSVRLFGKRKTLLWSCHHAEKDQGMQVDLHCDGSVHSWTLVKYVQDDDRIFRGHMQCVYSIFVVAFTYHEGHSHPAQSDCGNKVVACGMTALR